MSELGKVSVGSVLDIDNIGRLTESIRELTEQIKRIHQASLDESPGLEKYKQESTNLEFILITGGLINGKIARFGSQSILVNTDSGQNVILYKHSIAFIQEQTEE